MTGDHEQVFLGHGDTWEHQADEYSQQGPRSYGIPGIFSEPNRTQTTTYYGNEPDAWSENSSDGIDSDTVSSYGDGRYDFPTSLT